ncbi:MAG: bifunctional UDP-N-acetylmuramoyl-tripeptide:D-alanyl-D-alanine ligase/alanine racemase, partial [Sphingobacteriales bacterium]|nr:bifunctional UDP-N-acetylmuramoyl-tripeptide:D-alanyl-D-alanine ligase/alanine racemase [Sphingobacteriales bacterium]
MVNYTINDIAVILNSSKIFDEDRKIAHLLIDSRTIYFPSSSLFFALVGTRKNGHQFIQDLYEKGVRSFVISDFVDKNLYPDAQFIEVTDTLIALQQLAAHWRRQFHIPVIGITGSNGKTIVKEWLYQLLHEDFNIVRSPKSYNSQIGVPLSVWQMNDQHSLAIFEAGISLPNEMQRLEKVIAPTIGIFTNIGEAHSEGFLSIRQKIDEKLQLFVHSDLLIYCSDNDVIKDAVTFFINNVRSVNTISIFSWGKNPADKLQVTHIEKRASQTIIQAFFNNNSTRQLIECVIPFTDEASVENAITCLCLLLHLGVDIALIKERMSYLRNVEMRLALKQGNNNCSIINDSYSADINSLVIALNFLQQQQQHAKRTLILSDILQSGKSSDELYRDVAQILEQKNINQLIGIGPEISKHASVFNKIAKTVFFPSTAAFKEQFHTIHFFDETILLKGARIFEFEQIGHLLE